MKLDVGLNGVLWLVIRKWGECLLAKRPLADRFDYNSGLYRTTPASVPSFTESNFVSGTQSSAVSKDKGHHCQDQEHKEQDFGDPNEGSSNSSKSQESCDQSDHEASNG